MTHTCNKEEDIDAIRRTLDKIEALVPVLQEIVDEKKAMTILSKKIANSIKNFSIFIGIVGTIFGIAYAIYKELKKG